MWVCNYCVESCGGVVLGSYYGGGDLSLGVYGVGVVLVLVEELYRVLYVWKVGAMVLY